MQPSRTVKPHTGSDCPACQPSGTGHHLCQGDGCNEIATTQTRRHATDTEYAGIPATIAPLDGVAHITVHGCDNCADAGAFEPFCTHPADTVAPCPKCGAASEQSCTRADGRMRPGPHAERPQTARERCAHAHQPDCDVFTGCTCTSASPAPVRPKRAPGIVHWPDMTQMTIPIPAAQMLVAEHGIAWHQVAAIRSTVTQIGAQPAIDVEVYQNDPSGNRMYDGHGKPITETVEILLPTTTGATP